MFGELALTKHENLCVRSTWAQLIEGQPQHLGIAMLFGYWNALVVAVFQHAYIWVHMYCTEAPDMARIYTPKPDIAKAGPDA